MPIINTDIQYRLSGGAANSSAAASLGGAKSTTVVPSALFDDVSGAESAAGDIEYRCFYVHNNHGTLALQNAKLFIQANTPGDRLAVGVGTSAINGTEQTVADEQTAPSGVTFSQPADFASGISLGTIPAGQHKAVWVRRTVAPGTSASNDTYNFRVQGDTAA